MGINVYVLSVCTSIYIYHIHVWIHINIYVFMGAGRNPVQNPNDHSSNSLPSCKCPGRKPALQEGEASKPSHPKSAVPAAKLHNGDLFCEFALQVVFAPVTIPQVRVLLQERHSLRHRTAELYSVMALCPSWGAYPVQMRTSMGHFLGVSFLQRFWGKNMFQKGRTQKIAHKNLQPFMDDRSHEHSNILCQERFWKLRIGSI